jgi:hypothetical protein
MTDISRLQRQFGEQQQSFGAKSQTANAGKSNKETTNSSKVSLSALGLDLPRGPTAVRAYKVPEATGASRNSAFVVGFAEPSLCVRLSAFEPGSVRQ